MFVKNVGKGKIKYDVKKYESNIVNNSKVHPKVLYKYIKDKMKIKESIKAINGDDGTVLHNPKDICDKLNSWFHSVFQAEDLSHIPQVILGNTPLCQPVIFDPIDIADSLKQLDGDKFICLDNIHPYVLKQCLLIILLSQMFTISNFFQL